MSLRTNTTTTTVFTRATKLSLKIGINYVCTPSSFPFVKVNGIKLCTKLYHFALKINLSLDPGFPLS